MVTLSLITQACKRRRWLEKFVEGSAESLSMSKSVRGRKRKGNYSKVIIRKKLCVHEKLTSLFSLYRSTVLTFSWWAMRILA